MGRTRLQLGNRGEEKLEGKAWKREIPGGLKAQEVGGLGSSNGVSLRGKRGGAVYRHVTLRCRA